MTYILTTADLLAIGGASASLSICQGVVKEVGWLDKFGISQPHRLAHFLAQCGEESDHFHTLTEYASGAAYEGRKDLGNTRPGDGERYKGRAMIEATGRANYAAFTSWMDKIEPAAPDFEASPQALAIFPWALYAAVWYWMSHDLNRLADDNNIIAITEKVNGGLNGFGERLTMYARAGLAILGYLPTDIKKFQAHAGLTPDGIVGDKTRAAIHVALVSIEVAPAVAATVPPLVARTLAPAVIRPPRVPAPPKPPVAVAAVSVGAGTAVGAALQAGLNPWYIAAGAVIAVAIAVIALVIRKERGRK